MIHDMVLLSTDTTVNHTILTQRLKLKERYV